MLAVAVDEVASGGDAGESSQGGTGRSKHVCPVATTARELLEVGGDGKQAVGREACACKSVVGKGNVVSVGGGEVWGVEFASMEGVVTKALIANVVDAVPSKACKESDEVPHVQSECEDDAEVTPKSVAQVLVGEEVGLINDVEEIGLHNRVEVVDEDHGISDHECFQLIREESVDIQLFNKARRLLRGESSSKRVHFNQSFGDERSTRSRLWGIAKEISVICQDCEDSIIQSFKEMEERDNIVMQGDGRKG